MAKSPDEVLAEIIKVYTVVAEENAKVFSLTETQNPAENETKTAEEYKYLERDGFTSEIYKVELRGLRYYSVHELKSMLKNKYNLVPSKIKSPNRGTKIAYICFRNEEDYNRALKELDNTFYKGSMLKARPAQATPDPLVMQRKRKIESDQSDIKKPLTSLEATCPLAHMTYEDQLELKKQECIAIFARYKAELIRTNIDMHKYIPKFEFQGLTPSPKVNGYRNKNEFSIGRNKEGEIVVGFRVGSYSDGSTEVSNEQLNELPHLPESAIWAAESFQKFIKNHAEQLKLEPFDPITNKGELKQLMVRTMEKNNEIMIVVGVDTKAMTDQQLEDMKKQLKAFYFTETEQTSGKYVCTSLFYQDLKNRVVGNQDYPLHHLAGTEYITAELLGLLFRISPMAFFQVNTSAAEMLYAHIIHFGVPQPHTYVLDICCGTGTIGLSFANITRRVYGVDIIPDSIVDAGVNAIENDIRNTRFFPGDANQFISSFVREAIYDCPANEELDILAIVDPPRNGLHNRSIAAIRAAKELKRLIYVSCCPERAMRNWLDLCRPESKQYREKPFYPVKAVAVDMFPHTLHTEMVILFQRVETTETSTTASTSSTTTVATIN